MHLDQAAQAPLIVTVGTEKLSVPLFTLDEFIALARLADEDRVEAITRGFDPMKRVELLAFFTPPPATIDELRQHVRSPRGARHICLACLAKASVVERDGDTLPAPEPLAKGRAEQLVNAATKASLAALSIALADAEDRQPQPAPEEKPGADPLPAGSNPA